MKSAWSWDRWAFIGTNSSRFLWIKSRFNSWGLLGIFQYGGIPTPQCILGNFQDGGAAHGPKEIGIRYYAWYIWLYTSYLNHSCIVSRKKKQSPWLVSRRKQFQQIPHPNSPTIKQTRAFPRPQGQCLYSIPLLSPTCLRGYPGGRPLGEAADRCITRSFMTSDMRKIQIWYCTLPKAENRFLNKPPPLY